MSLRIILGLMLTLAGCTATSDACVSWNAIDEDVYVTEWQREHCTSIRIREIPVTAEYNP